MYDRKKIRSAQNVTDVSFFVVSMASSLHTRGRPSAGSKDGGAVGGDRCFFPFSACFGAMAVKQEEHKSDWEGRAMPRGSREIGRAGVAKEE